MKPLLKVLPLLLFVGCSNPLGSSSHADPSFLPGFTHGEAEPPTPTPTPTPTPEPDPVPHADQSSLVATPQTLAADGITTSLIEVTLKDQLGNPVSGILPTLSSTGAGHVLTQPSVATDTDGKTIASIRSSASGVRTISVSSPSGLSSVTVDITFSPLTPFTENFQLNSTHNNYNLSAQTLEYTSTQLRHKNLCIDQDNSNTGFGGAISTVRTEWNSTASALQLNASGLTTRSGEFVSRIIGAPHPVTWSSLKWSSQTPSGKPYPANAQSESEYESDNLDMSQNVLLYRFDESAYSDSPGQVIDSSGHNNHGRPRGGTNTSQTRSKFGRSAILTTNSSDFIQVPHSASLGSVATQMSWEAWIYPITLDDNPRGILAKREHQTSTDYAFSFFLFKDKKLHIDIAGTNVMPNGVRIQVNQVLTVNRWYHVAATFDGSLADKRLKVYINGSLAGEFMTLSAVIPATTSAAQLCVGCLPGHSDYTFRGNIDEVSIYRRVLSAPEIESRYRRGSRRIKLQVRHCDMSDCSDGTFAGPDGTPATFYSEGTNTTLSKVTTASLSLGSARQFFQYRAILESDDGVVNPRLESVEVLPSLYDSGRPFAINNLTFAYKTLTGFSASTSGTGQIRFQISNNGSSWYYWNGLEWTSATLGYTHANSASEINNQISQFPSAVGQGNFYFKAYFDSGSGAQDPAQLTSVSVTGAR